MPNLTDEISKEDILKSSCVKVQRDINDVFIELWSKWITPKTVSSACYKIIKLCIILQDVVKE